MKNSDATPASYIEHARKVNEAAGLILRLETTRDADWLAAKISIGLSLQAMELAGKAMLRSLGMTSQQIRQTHGKHKLLELLEEVQRKIVEGDDTRAAQVGKFLLKPVSLEGITTATTLGRYLREHFDHGDSAKPRNYFYPDQDVFTGPRPIQAIFLLARQLIDQAEHMEQMTT